MKKFILNIITSILSIIFCIIFFEFFLIIKNKISPNYDVEMWKYSKYLKEKHPNKKISHIHKKNTSAILQNIEIRTNEYGMRGSSITNQNKTDFDQAIMVLGSSVALGWGVKEEYIFSSKLEQIASMDNKIWKCPT